MRTRYRAIERAIDEVRPCRIMEIGVQQGLGARLMIERALLHRPNVHYFGFDLFLRNNPWDVRKELVALGEVQVTLVDGDSRRTLPQVPFMEMDLIYLDGDHSTSGQRADWDNCQRFATSDTVFMIDDYAESDDWGSRPLVESLRADHDVTISNESDRTAGSGRLVRMATVKRKT